MLAAGSIAGYESAMQHTTTPIFLPSEAATINLAAKLAPLARRGDAICLDGTLGAGKTLFARAFIRALTSAEEAVPSPTYALLQTYEGTSGPIAHFDLYRLDHEDELEEIGFFDCLEDAICLIEWPDKAGSERPLAGLTLHISESGDGRNAYFTIGDDWHDRTKALESLCHD